MAAPLVHLSARPETARAISGLCWPGAPDSELDELAVRSVLARRDRMAKSFEAVWLPAVLDGFVRSLSTGPSTATLAEFDNPWPAAVFRRRFGHIVDDVAFEPNLTDRVRWALGCEAEQSGARAGVAVPPPHVAGLGYLYFTQLHAVLHLGDGPVAIMREERQLRITNAHGQRFTLPREGGAVPAGNHAGGALQKLEYAGLWRLLNGIPLFSKFAPGKPVSPEAAGKSRAVIAEASQLLRAVWPAAHAFAERWLRGILVLEYPGFARSHTSVHAPQVLMCSTESASKIGEALCHELSHARMFIVMEQDPILNDDFTPKHRSPWRRDCRPLIGLLNGVHAFLNVCRYYDRLRRADAGRWGKEAESVLKAQRPKISDAWAYVQKQAQWTELGTRIASDLDEAVREVCG